MSKKQRRARQYRLKEALVLASGYGFSVMSIGCDYVERGRVVADRLVTLHQDWTSKGHEFVKVRLARGKWAGQDIGGLYRADGVP
ncbi:hypothetical protein UFOVP466_3 [uncultured Caudovirales phage]|uniref:Uncharacterized protein n=1 Tax=uncultured Caudovirales phage TaxID=2100421 RepID=A0A6J5RDE6_9CAUD|nr:hypothetical protein UFOVP466_3 [uncultured Caudovirales phage]CAB4180557.1 hypothetical protein UFOVP1045_50 [uncultured Caudovirales phage]CAB4189604.1 hypothetical protein UFOVP1194_4 [uncultured Caudovirales phage]CAB4221863.1 hypothetical protein UFOVP1641_100 [uncultured Caudovirales phage]